MKKTAFVVISCDNYSDLWPMFIHFFEKNWADCPLDKYFITNNKSIPACSFKEIKIGEDISWSNGLIKALNILEDNYSQVLITLEDVPIIRRVETDLFLEITEQFEEINGNYLKFITNYKQPKSYNVNFGIIPKGSLYRPTAAYALWNIKTFISLLRKEENAWEFERFGSVRSDVFDGFYEVNTNFFKILNTVIKGKWVSKAHLKVEKLGYQHNNNNKRKKLTFKESLFIKLNHFIYYLFTQIIPWKYRRKIVFKVKNINKLSNNLNI